MNAPGNDNAPQVLPYAKPCRSTWSIGWIAFLLGVHALVHAFLSPRMNPPDRMTPILDWLSAGAAISAVVVGAASLLRRDRRRMAGAIGVCLALIALIRLIGMPFAARVQYQQMACATNLHMVGLAMDWYRQDNSGTSPQTLKALVDTQMLSSEILLCPLANSGRSCDYFYCAPAPPMNVPKTPSPTKIIACDMKGNHPKGDVVVLCEDGCVEWLRAADFAKLLASPENAAFAAAWAKAPPASQPTMGGQ